MVVLPKQETRTATVTAATDSPTALRDLASLAPEAAQDTAVRQVMEAAVLLEPQEQQILAVVVVQTFTQALPALVVPAS